jgi:uncharacterized protein YbaR (Trm112 family)/SAM-dependent methyltransferase
LPLICPACRARSERGLELYTLRLQDCFQQDGADEVIEGVLACDNPACPARYPIIDGIPIVVADVAALLRTEIVKLVERDLHPQTMALLAAGGPDNEPYPQLVEHLSIYLDAHWGDRATPPPDGPAPAFGLAELAARLSDRQQVPVARAVELGCSVGRGLAELARGATLTVGVDLHFAALRRARRLPLGQPLAYARRQTGRYYFPATTVAGDLATPAVALICSDALDPPLAPARFERVAALNVLDSVRRPRELLDVLDGLCTPRGEILLASPYAYQSGIVAEDARLGGADPANYVRQLLCAGSTFSGRYAIEEESDLSWWLRRDARSAHAYRVHYLRARKSCDRSAV